MIQRIKESVTFALNNLNVVNQDATIGKTCGVMSHLLNKGYQIHHIDQMHHIGLMDHISLIDYVGLMDQFFILIRYLVF